MIITSRMLLASAVSVLALMGCSSNDATQAKPSATDAVAATVNGTPISERLVGLMLKQRTDLGREGDAAARRAFIDRMAMQLIIAQEAVKKGLDKAPEISDRIELTRQSVLVDAFIQDYLKNNAVSDDAVNAEYDKIKAQATGAEYKARHILVEKEVEAKEIIAKLNKDPKVFAALARKKSKDQGSRNSGGDLGWFDAHGMVPEFGAAVSKLVKGKFTAEPVKSQFGYHVILLEDSRPKAVQPLQQIKPALMQQLQEQNLKKLFDELKAKAKIDITQAAEPRPAETKDVRPADSGKK